jgi:ketosteroid isomerase-like protein
MRSSISHHRRAGLFAVAILIGAAVSSQEAKASKSPGHAARNKQIITEAFDRWAAGGTTFFTDVLAPDVAWTIEGSGPSAGTFRSRDDFIAQAVRPFASRLAEPVRPVSTRIWAEGDHVIVNWEGAGRARDGQPYTNRYAWIFRMQDGRAVEATAFLDLPTYDNVLRRIPAQPSE